MSDKISADYDPSWSASRLYLEDSSYDESRSGAHGTLLSPQVPDRAGEVQYDDGPATAAFNTRKQSSRLAGFPVGMQRRPLLGVRIRMALCLLLAALCILAHHSFYAFLHGRAVSDGPLSGFREELHAGMGEQALAITIGNALAVVAKACLAGAVVTAFEQAFWWRFKRRAQSLEQVDTMLAFRSNPLDPTSATAWRSFPFLSTIAFLAAAFVAVPIAAPGALTVNPAAQQTAPCTVPSVNISRAQLYAYTNQNISSLTDSSPTAGMYQMMSAALMAGNYLPPRTPELSDLSAYNVSFASVVMMCEDITDSGMVDLDAYLPYHPADSYGAPNATVWNATYDVNDDYYGLDFIVAARSLGAQFLADSLNHAMDGQHSGIDVVRCTPYYATYNVTIQSGTAGSDARALLQSVTFNSTFPDSEPEGTWGSQEGTQYYSIYDAFARTLNGNVVVSYSDNTTSITGNSLVAYSALALGATPEGNPWMWRTDLLHSLPSLMQNVSLSFLSGQLAHLDNRTALVDVATTCVFSGVRFQYNRARLLVTYLVAGACALGAVLLGFIVARQNGGVGESLAFSRMVGAGMDLRERLGGLHGAEGEADVTLKTRVRLEDKPYGSLVPQ